MRYAMPRRAAALITLFYYFVTITARHYDALRY